MKKLFKQPLFYTNLLLLALVILLGVNTPQARAKIIGFAKRALAAAPITGGGTINFLANFVGAASPSSELGNSIIYDDGSGHAAITTGSDPGSLDSKLEILSGIDRMIEFVRSGASFPTVFRMGSVDGALVINNNNADALTIKNGNVGIGTTNPTNGKLQVNGKVWAEAGDFITSGDNQAFGLRTNAGTYTYLQTDSSGNLQILKDDRATARMVIQQGGNVGIGTPSPARILEIVGSSADNTTSNGILRISNKLTCLAGCGGSTGASIELYSTEGTPQQVEMGRIATLLTSGTAGAASSDLAFSAIKAGTLTEAFRVQGSTGNVGIGTTNPQSKLEVNGAIMLTPLAADPSGLTNGMMWMRR